MEDVNSIEQVIADNARFDLRGRDCDSQQGFEFS